MIGIEGFTSLFLFADAGAGQAGGGSLLVTFAPLLIVFAAMYFLMIRPQKKRQKEIDTMRSNLSVGNRVTTIGGFIGKIKKITDDEVYLLLGNSKEHVVVRKWAIQGVVDPDEAKAIESKSKVDSAAVENAASDAKESYKDASTAAENVVDEADEFNRDGLSD